MGVCRRTSEVDYSLCLRGFPKYNSILTHYLLSAWLLHLLDILGNYVIRPGAIEQVTVVTNHIMTFRYTYFKRSLNNPPDVFYKLTHTV